MPRCISAALAQALWRPKLVERRDICGHIASGRIGPIAIMHGCSEKVEPLQRARLHFSSNLSRRSNSSTSSSPSGAILAIKLRRQILRPDFAKWRMFFDLLAKTAKQIGQYPLLAYLAPNRLAWSCCDKCMAKLLADAWANAHGVHLDIPETVQHSTSSL